MIAVTAAVTAMPAATIVALATAVLTAVSVQLEGGAIGLSQSRTLETSSPTQRVCATQSDC